MERLHPHPRQGDLTGDGKADIVAKDKSGVLWLYKGTGNYKAPFSSRTRVGGGWNTYNNIVSVGDIDIDGVTDLVARNKSGALYLYKGTGNAASPFKSPVKIGSGGWNAGTAYCSERRARVRAAPPVIRGAALNSLCAAAYLRIRLRSTYCRMPPLR